MIIESVKFRGHGCFQNEWSGFDAIKPINVIIGRNNSGKSHLLHLVEAFCSKVPGNIQWPLLCKGKLDEGTLRGYFRTDSLSHDLQGNEWLDHGKHFVDVEVAWETRAKDVPIFPPGFQWQTSNGSKSNAARLTRLRQVFASANFELLGRPFFRLLADRDIRPEPADNALILRPNGEGATNIIRRYITSSNPKLSRDLIQQKLLESLNKIFKTDGKFTEIQVKYHDEQGAETASNMINGWEIYLGEEKKGLIALSRSGSGLKTVILVLLNLLVMPDIVSHNNPSQKRFVFAFEELENNLHPALLRRLFQYLEEYAISEGATIFLTTHSSVALDLFGLSKNAQIIHVSHDGASAKANTVSAHFDHLGVISELGAKPSDLLQANGIIWVEGPSDCIYLNRWIDLLSDGKLQEGRDYLCAFYGGSLLARTQFASPEDAEAELVNLFRVNPNIVVVCDGDRTRPHARVKDRVRRIRAEVLKIPKAYIWVTAAREIENYIPGTILEKALDRVSLPDPDQYELFFPKKGSPGSSYLENHLKIKNIDKMDLAILCAAKMDKNLMSTRFDLLQKVAEIIEKIRSWNS